jgi:hypothetical protein
MGLADRIAIMQRGIDGNSVYLIEFHVWKRRMGKGRTIVMASSLPDVHYRLKKN